VTIFRSALLSLVAVARRVGRLFWDLQPWRWVATVLLIGATSGAMGFGYKLTGQPVTLVVNAQSVQIRTHRLHVASVLREAGLLLRSKDLVWPPVTDGIAPDDTIVVTLARPIIVEADGQTYRGLTHASQIPKIISEIGLALNGYDEVWVDGHLWDRASKVPPPAQLVAAADNLTLPLTGGRLDLERQRPALVRIVVRRAIPIELHIQDGPPSTFYTTRHTVGEALLDQGLILYLGDRVTPSLGAQLSPGMRVFVERSTPVSISADGRTLKTRTRRDRVGEVLAQEGVALMGQDYVLPAGGTPLEADLNITVVRVREALEIEQDIIPFESQWVPDPELEIDTSLLRQPGAVGANKRRYQVRYEDGQMLWRVLEDEWSDSEPVTKIIAYGTKIVPGMVQSDEGELPYWRNIRMLATTYSAATSGKAPDDPAYGITRSGLQAGYGVVAVDPSVVPLGTRLFVPGYGVAVAGDTGGAILGKHIDLGFDEDEPPLWYYWTDVYILGDPPPADKIRYVLPQWPQER
jgi:uncharacterized protein YabE (DUF348 family)